MMKKYPCREPPAAGKQGKKVISMSKKIRWITETALMLALLICLQALTKPMGQLVTGSCVNAILAVAALLGGVSCGVVVALCSPVLAFLLGIAPQILTVPAIMAGKPCSFCCWRCWRTSPARISCARLSPGSPLLPPNSPPSTPSWWV